MHCFSIFRTPAGRLLSAALLAAAVTWGGWSAGCTQVENGGESPSSGSPHPSVRAAPAGLTANALPGFADLHNHQFAEYAYQGAWYHGTTLGPEGGDGEWTGMAACDGNTRTGPQDHGMTYMNLLCGVAGWLTDDMCVHLDHRYGYVDAGWDVRLNYSGWPHSSSWAHQQTWWGHLQDAWRDGLNVTVVSLVNFEPLCRLMEPDNYKYFYDCNDMAAVDLQLEAVREFADEHFAWMEIAESPEDTRRIIAQGKLAMVISVEITGIFPTGDMDFAPMTFDEEGNIVDRGGVLTQLYRYYDLGVRSIQLAHQLDSRFTGVAFYAEVFELLAAIQDFQEDNPGLLSQIQVPGDGRPNFGFKLSEDGYNELGLTEEGAVLVREMMDLGMLVDLAHVSRKSAVDIYEIAKQNDYYPLFNSHAKFEEIMVLPGEELLEKYTSDEAASRVRVTGGMIAMRPFDAKVNAYPESGVENNCDGSSRSFAQAYAYADRELRVPVAFGVDLNGFADYVGPRFGAKGCDKAVDDAAQAEQQALQTDEGTYSPFDEDGLGHMGLLGRGLLRDLQWMGVDTGNIESSAERFAAMWERCLDPARSGPVGPPPVAEGSDLYKNTEGSGGLVIESIISETNATVGDYTIQVTGTPPTMQAHLYRKNGARLASVAYDMTAYVTDVDWHTFAFGDYLTIKIGSNSPQGSDLSTLETAFFDGARTITLAFP